MLSSGKILSGKILNLKEIALLYTTQTTCLFAYYSSYTVIRFLIWIRGMAGRWLSAITEGSLAMSLCIPRSMLPSSHNTLDTPFLIIIFITVFACLNCLSEPQLSGMLLWGAIHMHGVESGAPAWLLSKRARTRKRKIDMTQRPPTLSKPLKVRNPSPRVRRKPWKDPS